MYEEIAYDLEVATILENQYQNDRMKELLIKLINKKSKENKSYHNLQLLADVATYYRKIKQTTKMTDEVTTMIIKLFYINTVNNNVDINNFLNLTWKQIEEDTIEQIIDSEKINNLANNDVLNTPHPNQNFFNII